MELRCHVFGDPLTSSFKITVDTDKDLKGLIKEMTTRFTIDAELLQLYRVNIPTNNLKDRLKDVDWDSPLDNSMPISEAFPEQPPARHVHLIVVASLPVVLRCLIFGDPLTSNFKVTVDTDKDVGDLKELIKTRHSRFTNAHLLQLYRVNIPTSNLKDGLKDVDWDTPLRPDQPILEAFPGQPLARHVHIIVVAPLPIVLNYLIHGDDTREKFEIEITPDKDVAFLKNLIKQKHPKPLGHVSQLHLPIDNPADSIDWDHPLEPSGKIFVVFPNPHKEVFIVVVDEHAQVIDEDAQVIPELPEYTRYRLLINDPSAGAVQVDEGQIIHDGLNAPRGPSTVAPPITIYHPIFHRFDALHKDPTLQVSQQDLIRTENFMHSVSILPLDEATYAETVRGFLTDILGVPVIGEVNKDSTCPDGSYSLQIGLSQFKILLMEVKKHFGDGGSDPTIQTEAIREKCCCPMFMVAGAGPWLCVMGGVLTDKLIVQRLTDIKWLALSSTEEDERLYDIARTFVSLRTCLQELDKYYKSLGDHPLPLLPNQPHFPYPRSYIADDGATRHFEYLRALEEYPQCVTFLAQQDGGGQIVVKFTTRYGREVHEFLAKEGCAPQLYSCKPLYSSGSDACPTSSAEGSAAGLHLGSILMVVMEYVHAPPQYVQLPLRSYQKIGRILEKLHSQGYVLGDLRRPNLLLDKNGKIWFIDLDWSGHYQRAGIEQGDGRRQFVRYPVRMSTISGMWAPGMAPLELIEPQHDLAMLKKLQN